MGSIRKEIRNILLEELGVQLDIKKISNEMTLWVIDNIIHYTKLDLYKNNLTLSIPNPTPIHLLIENGLYLSGIKINLNFERSLDNIITGKFIPKNCKRAGEDFGIEIELILNINEFDESSNNRILSVISHELHHAFVYLKKYNKNSKSQVYNSGNNLTKFGFNNSNKEIKNFLSMIYLILPEETSARVQEAGTLLDKINAENYSEAIKELYNYQPINDASRMSKYNVNELNSIIDEELVNFISSFNSNIVSQGNLNGFDSSELKIIKNKEKFLLFWGNKINNEGHKLNKKILKLVSNKFNNNSNESDLLSELYHLGLFIDIFGVI